MSDEQANPQNTPIGRHEVIHVASIMQGMWIRYVEEHGAVEANEEVKALAAEVGERLHDFYQLVGRKWLGDSER